MGDNGGGQGGSGGAPTPGSCSVKGLREVQSCTDYFQMPSLVLGIWPHQRDQSWYPY